MVDQWVDLFTPVDHIAEATSKNIDEKALLTTRPGVRYRKPVEGQVVKTDMSRISSYRKHNKKIEMEHLILR
jgi:hypothetical protein